MADGPRNREPEQEPRVEGTQPRQARRPSVWRRLVLPLGAVAAVVLAIWLLEGRPLPGRDGGAPAGATAGDYAAVEYGAEGGSGGPRIGEPAPGFVLRDLEGRTVRLSDLRGTVVLVNFWATWCVPCKEEIPGLINVYEAAHDRGFELVAVDLEEPEDRVRAFVRDWGMGYTNVIDTDGDVARAYRLTGVPESFFIDRDGVLRELRIGKMEERYVACVVEALLADGAAYQPGDC